MYTSLAQFIADWKDESGKTAQVFAGLTDDSLAQPVSDDDRTLGRVAWHIATTLPEMCGRTGLTLTQVSEDAPVPTGAAAFARRYRAAAEELGALLEKEWSDDTLQVEDDMYGQPWKRGMTLAALIRHEIHHRGQMTVLMRQAGLRPPGIYGPVREQWAEFGQAPPEV